MVEENDRLVVSPYTDGATVPEHLADICYSSSAPGGDPINDGTGSIWMVIKPLKKYTVWSFTIEGSYKAIESLGRDVYRIDGVSSNLIIKAETRRLASSAEALFEDFAYAVTDEGELIINWTETDEAPLRYVEIITNDGHSPKAEYADGTLGTARVPLTEDKRCSVTVRAISYDCLGAEQSFNVCYTNKPRSVAFPRVEITTENFVLPTFDVVNSPSGAWGQGITNAFYEQCVMTVYNENNEVVYYSATDMAQGEEYLGAKLKVRGNTSASRAPNKKEPYKVKLSTKADLLEPLIGRPDDGISYEHKDWLLLNYGTDGYRIGGEAIADAVGMAWTPDYCYVALYVNGDYRGLYVLSESVSRGGGTDEEQWRVDVDKDGYLIECDAYWWNEDLYFDTPLTSITPMLYTFKHPDPDNIDENSPEYIYIKDYMTRLEDALLAEGDSYLDYIELDTFVRWLLVSDYLCINDGGGSNIFLYKEDSTDETKICLGPNWDYDSWMGSVEGLSTIRMYWKGAPFYIPFLLKKDSFNDRYVELFNETKDLLDEYIDEAYAKVDTEEYAKMLEIEAMRFGTKPTSMSDTKAKFTDWLDKHIEWMDNKFN